MDGLFSRPHRARTTAVAGTFVLVAFAGLALGTAMPVAVQELDGLSLYALAFGGFLAASVVGTVVGGGHADRRGPGPALFAGLLCFAAGTLLAGTAGSMPPFLLGRCVQGLGGGAVTVALYVVVGRAYPAPLRPRMFSLITACWILPSMLGPPVAGAVTERLSWRWVFHAIAVLSVVVMVVLLRPLRKVGPPEAVGTPEAAGTPVGETATRRARAAVTVAVGAGLIGYAGSAKGRQALPLAALGLTLLALSVRTLLPPGTLRARRGLPSLVLLRGVAAAAYFTVESFIPLMLVNERGISPTAAGMSLTGAALSWAGASWLQGRPDLPVTRERVVLIGALVHFCAAALTIAGVLRALPAATAAVGLVVAGFGMGLLLPGVGVLTLDRSAPDRQGADSAALQLADNLCSVLLVGACGAAFNAAHTRAGHDAGAFALVFAVAATVAGGACLLAGRVTAVNTSDPRAEEKEHAPL
ncbi:MFS transporter [Streptomyces netropsis]|uniref:MFS family permease n=1 Tax=Streptomyces netropsis TaxID=55404 RepID=A0A7W7L968_STRNE|nr:MFS transporter [Streptomyces netropsis]MBB4885882.1 MFS family permease [Streptomyces netropsis]GGR18026.1 MFS transporter [Streptomyces netropsis]